MNVLIVNGNDAPADAAFDAWLDTLEDHLRAAGHRVTAFRLRDMDVKSCIGCFDCWIKTPGVCVTGDAFPEVLRGFVAADAAVFASPLKLGFTTALLKKATDKIIPTLLPYIEGASGESRHFLRYGRSPRFAVVYAPEPDTDAEDLTLLTTLWRRLGRNAHTPVALYDTTRQSAAAVAAALAAEA